MTVSQSGPPPSELKFRKIMGRTYLHQNDLEAALEVYSGILRDYPQDVDALLVIGNLYLASGDPLTAQALYQRALEADPANLAVRRQHDLAAAESAVGKAEVDPLSPGAVSRLLQRLIGKPPQLTDHAIEKAARLLDLIIHSESPAEQVALHLEEMDDLLPALLELNVRQAELDGRADLAEGLRALQQNILLQKQAEQEEEKLSLEQGGGFPAFHGKALILTPDPENLSGRMALLAEAIEQQGGRVQISGAFEVQDAGCADVVIASNPHPDPSLLETLAVLAAYDVPILLDLDTDFENLPVSHPLYGKIGLSSPSRARGYTASLFLASRVIVNSQALAEVMCSAGHPARYIPDSWNRKNPLWEQRPSARNTFNLGWMGNPGQMEDLAMVRRAVLRILREFPQTQVVIIGDMAAYRLFEALPESRRVYLPSLPASEHPYLLSQMDLLLVPLRNQPFYQTVSDTLLLEAGARGIPWVASPVPAFRDWAEGGVLVESLEEWHQVLRQLVLDAEYRQNLSRAGRLAALKREVSRTGRLWLRVIQEVVGVKEKGKKDRSGEAIGAQVR